MKRWRDVLQVAELVLVIGLTCALILVVVYGCAHRMLA
jgi:hypothetical protein